MLKLEVSLAVTGVQSGFESVFSVELVKARWLGYLRSEQIWKGGIGTQTGDLFLSLT